MVEEERSIKLSVFFAQLLAKHEGWYLGVKLTTEKVLVMVVAIDPYVNKAQQYRYRSKVDLYFVFVLFFLHVFLECSFSNCVASTKLTVFCMIYIS